MEIKKKQLERLKRLEDELRGALSQVRQLIINTNREVGETREKMIRWKEISRANEKEIATLKRQVEVLDVEIELMIEKAILEAVKSGALK